MREEGVLKAANKKKIIDAAGTKKIHLCVKVREKAYSVAILIKERRKIN
jgi:hypothetical protein